ncbi:T9SS type A sorting domain-containing protein [bacterium]|nr:T9SS type A sorting domain-containing protein [bacterium]
MKVKSSVNLQNKPAKRATELLWTVFLISWAAALAQDPNFFIYLCFGQSNMEGQGTIETQDRTVDSRFQVLWAVNCSNLGRVKNNWYTARPPLCRCWNGLSPADYFGRTMLENLPDSVRIGVVNVSVGGCRIELFDKDIYQDYDSTYTDDWFLDILKEYNGNPYQVLIDLAKLAQESGVIRGILLHQGESNTGDAQWPAKVSKIYGDIMDDLDLDPDEVPLLAGEVVHADQGGVCASMNSIIDKLPQTLPNSYVISSSGCTDKTDNIHFDSAGYRELGKRYAFQMLSIMGIEPVGIENDVEGIEAYGLKQNYPNPFNPETSISYRLPEKDRVTLEIIDIAGRIIETLVDDAGHAGEHSVTFNASDLSSGIYFYRLRTAAGFIQSKKMLLVK